MAKKENKKMTCPADALRLKDLECGSVEVFTEGENKEPQLRMDVYSGGMIKDHFWWGNLVIDLEGMVFDKKKFPILEDHMTDKKIGFSGKPSISEGKLTIDPKNAEFVDTPSADEFVRLSKQGFPYQSSLYAKPLQIDRFEKGQGNIEVNGKKFKDVDTVWRKSLFKESSICVFGYDSNTNSSAFTEELDINEAETNESQSLSESEDLKGKEDVIMTKEEMKEKYPELFKEITEEAVAAAQTSFSADKQKAEDEVTALKTQLAEKNDRILKLEKSDALRSISERKAIAKGIWAQKLSQSTIPESLYDKVTAMIPAEKFVKDDVLDETAFAEAVVAEIADWEKKGATTTVIGSGFTEKTTEEDPDKKKKEELVETTTNKLLAFVGKSKK